MLLLLLQLLRTETAGSDASAADRSFGYVVLGASIAAVVGLYAAVVPFVAPVLRRHVLPYVPASPQVRRALATGSQACCRGRSMSAALDAVGVVAARRLRWRSSSIVAASRCNDASDTQSAARGAQQIDLVLRLCVAGPAPPPRRLVDLGSGDGRVVIAAARRLGIPAVGLELNPWLVCYARIRARLAGVAHLARFERRDLWRASLTDYDAVLVFGTREMLPSLEAKLATELRHDARVVACRFPLPTWTPAVQVLDPMRHRGILSAWLYYHPAVAWRHPPRTEWSTTSPDTAGAGTDADSAKHPHHAST